MSLKITDWAVEDRPGKMIRKGISTLSDAELLAILISSGTERNLPSTWEKNCSAQ